MPQVELGGCCGGIFDSYKCRDSEDTYCKSGVCSLVQNSIILLAENNFG